MAVTRLSDVIVPEVFTAYMLKETTSKADIFKSGIVSMNPDMGALLGGGGTTFQTPFWTDLSDASGSTTGSDDPAQVITPDKISALKMAFRRQFRTKAWSTADLVAELAGDDPMSRIVSRVSEWWARDFNRTTISTLNGLINRNIASEGGDLVYSAGVGAGGATPTAAISGAAILEAKQTMGDRADGLTMIMMHSRVYTNLQLQNLIAFIPNSEGKVNIPTYMGYQVLVSDTCPVTLISGVDYSYLSYLCAPGVLGFAESPPEVPVETFRYPDQGNGAGVEALFTRRQFALHPAGYNWKETTVTGSFPSNANLELATNWERKFPERKHIPFVAIKSKNG